MASMGLYSCYLGGRRATTYGGHKTSVIRRGSWTLEKRETEVGGFLVKRGDHLAIQEKHAREKKQAPLTPSEIQRFNGGKLDDEPTYVWKKR